MSFIFWVFDDNCVLLLEGGRGARTLPLPQKKTFDKLFIEKIEVEEGCKEVSVADVESLPEMYKYCRLRPLPNIDNDIQFYI